MNIELDNRIIDSNTLKKNLIRSAQEKNIPPQYMGDSIDGQEISVSLPQLREVSMKTDRMLTELTRDWQIREMPITSHRHIIGHLIVILKKTFRKTTRWLFSSYYEQESKFNYEVVQCLSEVHTMQKMILKYIEQEERQGE